MGPGRSPGGSPEERGKPPEAAEFSAFQTLNFEYPEKGVSSK